MVAIRSRNDMGMADRVNEQEFQYECRVCGVSARFWRLNCPACHREGKLRQRMAGHAELRARIHPLNTMTRDHPPRISTSIAAMDHVLGGGGVIPGTVALVVGDRGVGKSTLLLQACVGLSLTLQRVLYVSGEEAESQFSRLVVRLGYGDSSRVSFLQSEWIEELLFAADMHRPQAMVVDSAQAFASPTERGQRGGTAQIRRLTRDLIRLARQSNVAIFLVGQTNDDGSVAGPKKLEFWVDAVIRYKRVARSAVLREITATKNRFGKEGDRLVLEMTAEGLRDTGEIITAEARAAARKERDDDDDGDRSERRPSKKTKGKAAKNRPPSRPPPSRPTPPPTAPRPPQAPMPDPPPVPPAPPRARGPFVPTIIRNSSPSRLSIVRGPVESPPVAELTEDPSVPGVAPGTPSPSTQEPPECQSTTEAETDTSDAEDDSSDLETEQPEEEGEANDGTAEQDGSEDDGADDDKAATVEPTITEMPAPPPPLPTAVADEDEDPAAHTRRKRQEHAILAAKQQANLQEQIDAPKPKPKPKTLDEALQDAFKASDQGKRLASTPAEETPPDDNDSGT
jgi:KaiC/GvpD/RAD55 family RecA-like ATPase